MGARQRRAVKVDGVTASRLALAHQQPFSFYTARVRGEIEPPRNAFDANRLGMPDSPGWQEVEQQNVCVHVSGHAAVAFALGQPRAKISLTIVVRPYDGITAVSFSGATRVSEDLKARFDEDDQSSILDYAAAGAAGPLAEAKRCQLNGLPNNSYRCAWGDWRNIDYAVKRAGWLNPQTFRRLAQWRARVALDHPPIWRAVTDLATQLNKGYWPWPEDGGWSLSVGVHTRAMDGATAEAIMREAGAYPGCLGSHDLSAAQMDRHARRVR